MKLKISQESIDRAYNLLDSKYIEGGPVGSDGGYYDGYSVDGDNNEDPDPKSLKELKQTKWVRCSPIELPSPLKTMILFCERMGGQYRSYSAINTRKKKAFKDSSKILKQDIEEYEKLRFYNGNKVNRVSKFFPGNLEFNPTHSNGTGYVFRSDSKEPIIGIRELEKERGLGRGRDIGIGCNGAGVRLFNPDSFNKGLEELISFTEWYIDKILSLHGMYKNPLDGNFSLTGPNPIPPGI